MDIAILILITLSMSVYNFLSKGKNETNVSVLNDTREIGKNDSKTKEQNAFIFYVGNIEYWNSH